MKSAGNGGVVQSCPQMLHVHVFLAAPLGARRVAKSGADQHQGRVAVRERPHHTDAADLTVQPLDHVVGADARPVLAGKSAVGQRFLCTILGHSLLSPFRMVCGNFILPEPANYVFFYAIFNLRNLLYIIPKECLFLIFPFHQWHSSFASVFPDGSSLYAKRRLLCESLSLIFLAGIPPHVVPDSLMLFVTTALAPIATSDAMEISPIIFAPDAINTLFPITAHLSDPFVAPMVTPSCILQNFPISARWPTTIGPRCGKESPSSQTFGGIS